MKNSIKNLLLIIVVCCFSIQSFAKSNDYDSDYTEDEGRLIFKIRGYGMLINAKQKGLPVPTVTQPSTVSKLFTNGYGLDTATGIFFNDNIAFEMSLGVMAFKISSSSLNDIANNYNGNPITKKNNNLYMIPLSATVQYHIAPFGGIRPYLGVGYHVAYALTRGSAYKVDSTHGLVMQVGVDFIAKDDTIITFDVRKFTQPTKVTYKAALVNPPISSKVNINPLVLSLGIGFKL